MTLRGRLTATALVTLAVGLGALLVAGNVLLAQRVSDEISSQLNGRAEAQIAALSIGANGIRVRETANDAELDRDAWVFYGDRVVERPPSVAPALDRAAVALGRAQRGREVDGPGEKRLLARPLGPRSAPIGAVVVTTSVSSLEELQGQVLIGSIVFAALVMLAGWLAIRSAVGGALEPVARMTASAEDWSEHDLDRRFELGPARDELTALAATLDSLLARIAASRRHEQRFAEDAAHELRTPLARIRGRAELALTGDASTEREDALRAVIADTDELAEVVETLLTVARQSLAEGQGGVDLAPIARSFDGVEVAGPEALPPVEGDAEIVRRALAPLVENALRHRRSRAFIELSADGEHAFATVRDDGPGIDPALGERAFDPGAQGGSSGGAGLGLPLARRLARACGGDVVLGAGPGGSFVLALPRLDRHGPAA